MNKIFLFLTLFALVSSYLKSTKNCQVNDPAIKKKAKSLKGKTNLDTAKNIFKFVQNKIRYERYANSKKGAVKTLLSGKGNCCDQAHLLVALWRADGIDARYAHGTNHWWGQCIINGKKCDCDPTNKKHEFCKPKHPPKHKNPKYFNSLNH